MIEIITDRFIINFQNGLEEFVSNSLKVVEKQMPILRSLFLLEVENFKKIEASFFTERSEFVGYIKSISNGDIPPKWATGCFYNEGIQTLININDEEDVKYKTHTLMHEMVHLYIQKLVYEKSGVERVRWFDESYASYIDGYIKNITSNQLKNICEKLIGIGEFDLNILDDINKVKTKEYDGYDMFLIVGKYIFENNLAKHYLELLKTKPSEIRKVGKTILEKSINYILKKQKQ